MKLKKKIEWHSIFQNSSGDRQGIYLGTPWLLFYAKITRRNRWGQFLWFSRYIVGDGFIYSTWLIISSTGFILERRSKQRSCAVSFMIDPVCCMSVHIEVINSSISFVNKLDFFKLKGWRWNAPVEASTT